MNGTKNIVELWGGVNHVVLINRIRRVGQVGQMENAGELYSQRMLDLSVFKNEQVCIMKNLQVLCGQDLHLGARTSLERSWLFLEKLG